jgi:nucleoside-triphosphatase THEP1
MEIKRNILLFLTGKPRSGKTTLVKEVIERLKEKKGKIKLAGIITPEFKNEKGEREGFLIRDLKTGREEILASIKIKSALLPF